MKRYTLTVCTLATCLLASGLTNDIMCVKPDVLSRIEEAVWTELLCEGVVTAQVVDICVVGSYAQGCARTGGENDSDIDIVVFAEDYRGCPPAFRASFNRRVAQRSGMDMRFDISLQLTNRMQKNNPDWIAYSLRERTLYGRPGGTARNVKLVWSKDKWVAVARDMYAPAEAHRRKHGSVIVMSDGLLKCVHPGTGKILTTFPVRVETTIDGEERQP